MQRPASRGLGAAGGVRPPPTGGPGGGGVHRPVTQQGLRGQRTAVPGQGRHGDFTTKASVEIDLRKRIQMLNDEIQKMDHESERINEEAEEVNRLEPQYKMLLDEVRNLEGTLADYNLAFDKMRANTTEQDVQIEVNRTKQRKTVLQNEQDALFRQQQVEKEKVLDLENMLRQDIHHDQLQEIDGLVHALDELQMDYEDHKEMLAQMPEVDTSWERTTARLKTLERDHIRLDELVKIFNIPDPQERHNAIMGYTRQKKSDQTASTQAVNMARANISRFSKELKEADNPAYVPVTSEVEAEQLHAKYTELQASVEQMQRHGSNRDALENEIQQMLVRMSKTLSSVQQLPDADQAADVVDELQFKTGQLENAKTTDDRLRQELAKRKAELDKIQHLDYRCETEMDQLKEKMQNMQNEIPVFEDIDGVRQESELRIQKLQKQLQVYTKRKEGMRQAVEEVHRKHNELQQLLNASDIQQRFDQLEHQIKMMSKSNFSIEEMLANKEAETNFETVKQKCMEFVHQINGYNSTYTRPQAAMGYGF